MHASCMCGTILVGASQMLQGGWIDPKDTFGQRLLLLSNSGRWAYENPAGGRVKEIYNEAAMAKAFPPM